MWLGFLVFFFVCIEKSFAISAGSKLYWTVLFIVPVDEGMVSLEAFFLFLEVEIEGCHLLCDYTDDKITIQERKVKEWFPLKMTKYIRVKKARRSICYE